MIMIILHPFIKQLLRDSLFSLARCQGPGIQQSMGQPCAAQRKSSLLLHTWGWHMALLGLGL